MLNEFHEECVTCPFSLLCLMGRFCNDGDVPQVYLCPKCGCTGQEQQPFVHVRCPSRKLTGAWKGGWMSKYQQNALKQWPNSRSQSYETLATSYSIDDPMHEDCRLPLYLCEDCWQDPPPQKVEVSIYDFEAGPP